jgi:GAF domain-containing protein
MFVVEAFSGTKQEMYDELLRQARGLLEGERDLVANAANLSALIWQLVPDLNWAGFYFMKGGELVLGPFQGKPACVRIKIGKGVCGTAVSNRASVLVEDVHLFPGHIACDAASNSELVVPLIRDKRVHGVLDLDSPSLARFDAVDQIGLERVVAFFVAATDFPSS